MEKTKDIVVIHYNKDKPEAYVWLHEYSINLTTWNAAGGESNSGIIPQLDIANSTMYSKITEKTIKEALNSLARIKKKNG